ncbi:hypothetical protein pfor_22c2452 [Rhodobacteraceae bacterium SB2]|nr:hypothetical protein pfor_22c2452 [Rhodobacteraceae bacterium SB2]
MFNYFLRYCNTIKYLKYRQLFFQLIHKTVPKTSFRKIKVCVPTVTPKLEYYTPAYFQINCGERYISLFELNKYYWDGTGNAINSNDYLSKFSFFYYEFLLCTDLPVEAIKYLLQNISSFEMSASYINHPYTVSKRIISLVILSCYRQNDVIDAQLQLEINNRLSEDISFLTQNIEYHIDGNHILTNFLALALVYKITRVQSLEQFEKKYLKEFEEQFSGDEHYERSYSYSKQLLYEFILYYQLCSKEEQIEYSGRIKSIYYNLTRKENIGNFKFGDNIDEQCCSLHWLSDFIRRNIGPLESGNEKDSFQISNDSYILLNRQKFCLAIDAGKPSPSFQPGHAHDSTGALLMKARSLELVTCSGTSTYDRSTQRKLERSRYAYSRPISLGFSQEVWSSFRVARRHDPKISYSSGSTISIEVPCERGAFVRTVEAVGANEVWVKDSVRNVEHLQVQFLINPELQVKQTCQSGISIFGAASKIASFSFSKEADLLLRNLDFGVKYGQVKSYTCVLITTKTGTINTRIKIE